MSRPRLDLARQDARTTARTPWRGRIELFRARTPLVARARDISPGGLFVETRERLAEGSYLTIGVAIPGEARFVALCRVTRVTSGRSLLVPAGVGLRFLDVCPHRSAQIASFVARRGDVGGGRVLETAAVSA